MHTWFNQSERSFSRTSAGEVSTVRDLIDQQTCISPVKDFLICPTSSRSITYRALRDSASILCASLRARGMARGDKIALLLDNGVFTAQLFLGLLYGGFVPVPLGETSGTSHLVNILKRSDARLLYIDPSYRSLVGEVDCTGALPMVFCDPDGLIDGVPDPEGTLPAPHSEDDALLDFTSGSTGTPKGVLVTHRNILAGATNTVEAHALTASDRSLCVLPLHHMNAQVVTLLSTLRSGGSVVMPRRFEAGSFWSWLSDYRCTWSTLVPSMINQLLAAEAADAKRCVIARQTVRFLRSSSAPLSVDHHEQFERVFQIPLLEAMGSTEAGGAIFSNPLPPAVRKIGSPGIPYGFDVRIVGEGDAEVGQCEEGEIQVRGPSVMKHYFKDPEGTRRVFSVDGWLRTGDIGCQDEDGFFFITGRNREIIIKGGEKIAPREIDEVIGRLRGVAAAAAIGVPDPQFGEDIVAYVVLQQSAEMDENEILRHCVKHVGILKTPRRIVFIDSLPMGAVGKVQRSKLVEHYLAASAQEAGQCAGPVITHDTVLERLTKIWGQVLGRERVCPTDSFFDLGGDSLLALQLMYLVEMEFAVKLPFASLFENPTVDWMAKSILSRRDGNLPISPSCRDGSLPIPLVPANNGVPPFFAVYGMENISAFRTLASRLRPGQPFYVLPALGLDESDQTYPDLETMASAYLGLIRSAQPKGPYYLGGRCMGGPIAFEIAQQLLRAGDNVALLVVFDSRAPRLKDDDGHPRAGDPRTANMSQATRPSSHRTFTHTLARLVRKKYRKHVRRIPELARRRLSGQNVRYVTRLRAANKALRRRYRATVYPGQITLIRSANFASRAAKDHHIPGWRELSGGGLVTHMVQGSHTSMFDELHVTGLAQRLQDCIDKAREAS